VRGPVQRLFRPFVPTDLRSGKSPWAILGAARRWFTSRLGRRTYILWSPISPEEVASLLSTNLKPEKFWSFGRRGTIVAQGGAMPTWWVRISNRSLTSRNSSGPVFNGVMGAGERGT
jgi:hypothetical protein